MVGISQNHSVLAYEENNIPNTHANFVQVAIERIVNKTNIPLSTMDAIVVTMGPGSYTGLRVGLASAKGIAYAISKPLIGLSTLTLLAQSISTLPLLQQDSSTQIFSMIDARRMEVFGAIYNAQLQNLLPAQSILLSTNYMEERLHKGPIICVGSGVEKTKTLLTDSRLFFSDAHYTIEDCMLLATEKWNAKEFEDLAYTAPDYLKDFYQKPA